MRIIANNKQAFHNYFVLSTYEAGLVLVGSEVKSVRLGNVNLKDSFVIIRGGEAVVKNMHIKVYEKATVFTVDDKRDRKLLLNKNEILKLAQQVKNKGLTIVPLKIYFKGQFVKMEIGLCKGKHTYDKKRVLAENDVKREVQRQLKNYS